MLSSLHNIFLAQQPLLDLHTLYKMKTSEAVVTIKMGDIINHLVIRFQTVNHFPVTNVGVRRPRDHNTEKN